MTPQSKVFFKVTVTLVAVFALGSIAGAALDGVYRAQAGGIGRTPSIRDGEAYLRVLDSQLHLNAGQQTAMRAVLNQTRDEYSALCSSVRPRYNDVRDRARQRLRELLTPDQQTEFDQLVTQENCNCPDQTIR